jgi:hypothetical protein
VRRVARLRRRREFVGDVHQVLTERGHDLMVSIASHYNLIVGRRADDEVRQLKALLFQTQADERISFAEDFSEDGGGVQLGMRRSKPV